MNIEVGKYLLTTDKHNFIVSVEYEKKTGAIAYKEVSYHGSMKSAFKKMLTLDLASEDIANIDDSLKVIQRHQKDLERLYEDLRSVIREVSK